MIISLLYSPYFYIAVKKDTEKIVAAYLERKYRSQLADVQIMGRLDLDKIEHIVGTYHFLKEKLLYVNSAFVLDFLSIQIEFYGIRAY